MTEFKGKRFKTSELSEKNAERPKRTPRFKTNNMQSAYIGVPSEEPTRISPEISGSLPKLSQGQGAVVQNRENAASTTGSFKVSKERIARHGLVFQSHKSRDIRVSKRPILAILACALVLCGLMAFMFHGALSSATPGSQQVGTQASEPTSQNASKDGSVEFDGNVFSLSKDEDGVWSLISKPKDSRLGDVREYCKFAGTPVGLMEFKGNFIVGENLKDGTWDIVSYTVTDGALVNKLVDKNGKDVQGKGKIKVLKLIGNNKLLITLEDGSQTTQTLS